MNPCTFIAIADVHLQAKLFNLPELEQDLRDTFLKACDLAIEKKVTYLLVVGDLYDHNKPTPDVVRFVSDQVKRLKQHNVEMLGIAGDHDKVLNGETWVSISNIWGIESDKRFAGHNYVDNPDLLFEHLRHKKNKEQVEWIFLHGQDPILFPFVEAKKRLDFKEFPLLELYPNLKGVVLGDIHTPYERYIEKDGRKVFIGYCGSLGYVKSDEVGTKQGLLYFDGKKLSRLPFPMERDFVRLHLTKNKIEPVDFYYSKYKDYKGKKPVFIVEYDRASADKLDTVKPLYEVGLVKLSRKVINEETGKEETINIRSELSSVERIGAVLRTIFPDETLYDVTFDLLTGDDPKTTLDEFKRTILDEKEKSGTQG